MRVLVLTCERAEQIKVSALGWDNVFSFGCVCVCGGWRKGGGGVGISRLEK